MSAVVTIHVADLHFGCRVQPMEEYKILKEQMLDRVKDLSFDIFSIDGDLFDKKLMANNDAILAANMFVEDVVNLCKTRNATLIILAGTRGHDAGQLRLFYHYLEDPSIDIRIIEQIQFVYAKGCNILCIPELYGLSEDVYHHFLNEQGMYDMCFMHGTFEGSVRGNNVGESRLFTMNDFKHCYGPIVSGHVHTGGCFQKHFYYTGSPIRYTFGEEKDKGFLIMLYDNMSKMYYPYLSKIESYRYDTIDLSTLAMSEPQQIIKYVNDLHDQGIDYIRLVLDPNMSLEAQNILKNYWAMKDYVKIKMKEIRSKMMEDDGTITIPTDFPSYLNDKSMNPYDKLSRFIQERTDNKIVLTGEEIKNICMGK